MRAVFLPSLQATLSITWFDITTGGNYAQFAWIVIEGFSFSRIKGVKPNW